MEITGFSGTVEPDSSGLDSVLRCVLSGAAEAISGQAGFTARAMGTEQIQAFT